MAINKEKEIENIFNSFKNEIETDKGILALEKNDSGISYIEELYQTLSMFMNYEISGLKMSIWIFILSFVIMLSGIIWYKINKKKIHNDEELYKKAKNYIQKAGDLERRTMPFFMLIILLILLFIEASGFSYVFSDLMIDDASEKILQYAMIFGGFIVSIVLMFLTHFTGEEIHKNSVLKAIDNEMASIGREKILLDKEAFPKNRISLENTLIDDKAITQIVPQYNRIAQKYFDWKKFTTNRKYFVTSFTIIFILSIGIGAMFVRFFVFDKNVEKYQSPINMTSETFNVKTHFLNSEEKGLNKNLKKKSDVPSYYMNQAELRDKYQHNSKVEAEKKASYITYIVMMMLFFGIQVVGLISGTRYCFIGLQSKEAYKNLKSYKEK